MREITLPYNRILIQPTFTNLFGLIIIPQLYTKAFMNAPVRLHYPYARAAFEGKTTHPGLMVD